MCQCMCIRAGFPRGSAGKKCTCNAGDPSSIPGLGRSAREGIGYSLQYSWASLMAQLVKKSTCNAGYDPWIGKIPWRRERLPTPVFWPGEFQGLYSSWGHRESDMAEQLSLLCIQATLSIYLTLHLFSPTLVHMSVLCVHISVAALQTDSSVPSFWVPLYMH